MIWVFVVGVFCFFVERMDLARVLLILSFVHMTRCAIVPASKSSQPSSQVKNCTISGDPTIKCNITIVSSTKRRNSLLFSNKRRSRIRQFKNSLNSTVSTMLSTISTQLPTVKNTLSTILPTISTESSTMPPTMFKKMPTIPPTVLPTIAKKLSTKRPTVLPTILKKQPLLLPTVKPKPQLIKRRPSKRHHDLQLAPSFLSEIAVNYPHLSKPLAMYKRPAGKSDFMGLGVMPPRGSPAAKGPFKPAVIYKGLIRKQKPGMQFKRTPNGPPPMPPPMPPQVPELPTPKGRDMPIPSEHASQFSEADPNSGSYKFGYDTGTFGEQSYRYEKRDPDGKVTGKYGYIDPEGVLREVNYIADAQGYRPTLVNRYRVDMHFPFIGPVPSKLNFS